MQGEGRANEPRREEWQELGLDPRQWAYSRWWTAPGETDGDPEPLDPQPAPPRWAWFASN